jgi:hypothetical protein
VKQSGLAKRTLRLFDSLGVVFVVLGAQLLHLLVELFL